MPISIFSITNDDVYPYILHVKLAAATEMSFDISWKGLDFSDVVREICRVAPALFALDVDLMEIMDGSDVKTNPAYVLMANRFAVKYHDALSNVEVYVTEKFGGKGSE